MKKRIIQSFRSYLRVKNVLLNILIFLLYVIFGKLGLSLAFANPNATAIWPPTGIALAALLIFGFRVFPAIFLGAFFVNLMTSGGIATSLGIALGNTLEGVAGAYLVKRFAHGVHAFDSVVNIFKFTFLAAFLSTTISATIGVLTLLLGHLTTLQDIWFIWLTWWFGDMGGNIVIAPLLLVWATHPRIRITPRGALHFSLATLLLILVTEIVFLGVIPYSYLCIPLVVWIAFWFGRRGATVATFLVSTLAIIDTLFGMGPFAQEPTLNHSFLLLQTFLSVLSLTGLTFAATLLAFRKSENVITSQTKRFRALIEKSFDAVVLIDTTSKISYASPSFETITGYTPKEIEGTIGFDLVHPEDRSKTMKVLATLVLKPGSTATVEYRTIRKDGKILWVEAVGTNLLFDPAVNAIVVNFRDISDRKMAAEKLLEEKIEDEAMLGSIGDGIIATDKEGNVTMINKRGCDILGWKEKELLGKPLIATVPMQDENNHVISHEDRPLTHVLSLGKKTVTSSAIYYVRKDKTMFPVHFTITPIIIDKQIVGTIEVFQDITQEKAVDKAKTEFVSLASHQLRTPLATINWYLEELLRQGKNFTEKQTTYVKEVYAASKRMVDLINALLNTSRLELGTFVVEPEEIDLITLIKQIVQDLKPKVKEKAITIQENYQENLSRMYADPKLLTIIIQNLIANAIKYTKPNDTITVEVKYTDDEFVLSVKDNGYGIPKNQQANIFSKLFRADNARVMEPEGSGLGLYIVKSIVTVTGGKVWFTSEENKGTTFFVSFPRSGMQQKTGQKQLI